MKRRNAIIWKDFYEQNEFCEHITLENGEKMNRIMKPYMKDNQFNFIDLCCGTGCLGISLLKEFKSSKCDFIDISNQALLNCKTNISKLSVENRSTVFESNLFENYPITKLKNIRFIICNPPYIPTEDYFLLDKETHYDPKISLVGGSKGIDFYTKIIVFEVSTI